MSIFVSQLNTCPQLGSDAREVSDEISCFHRIRESRQTGLLVFLFNKTDLRIKASLASSKVPSECTKDWNWARGIVYKIALRQPVKTQVKIKKKNFFLFCFRNLTNPMNGHLSLWVKSFDMNSVAEGWVSRGISLSSFLIALFIVWFKTMSLDYIGKQRKIIKTMKIAVLSKVGEGPWSLWMWVPGSVCGVGGGFFVEISVCRTQRSCLGLWTVAI